MAEDKKNNFVRDWFEELSPSMKMLVIVIVVIVVIVIVGKVRTQIEEARLRKFGQRSSLDGSTVRDPRPLVDNIYEKLAGTNWLYVYPEVVNKLANLSEAEIQAAVDYFDQRYASESGYPSLYDFINAEWDGGEYEPALAILRQYGHG